MKKQARNRAISRRNGVVLILVLVLLVALLAMVAFAVDVAYMQLTRSQLRAATDAAALAGAESLVRTYDKTQALAAAKRAASLNPVAGKTLQLVDSDILFGRTMLDASGNWTFVNGGLPTNCVQVAGNFTRASQSGSVSLFFGPLMNVRNFEPVMTAAVATDPIILRDFAIVVDRSGSMHDAAGGTVGVSKWQTLNSAFADFVNTLSETVDTERIGLASYSSAATLDAWLTTYYTGVQSTLASESPNGSTNIGSGITEGTRILSTARPEAEKIMVLMTDGIHNTGPEPIYAAQDAASVNIRIIAISFGEDKDVDIVRMDAIAAETKGKHFHAPTAADLKSIFEEIGRNSGGLSFTK